MYSKAVALLEDWLRVSWASPNDTDSFKGYRDGKEDVYFQEPDNSRLCLLYFFFFNSKIHK